MNFTNLADRPELVLLNCRSGSHAYGLAGVNSDEDFRGVFLYPKQLFFGLDYVPQLADEHNDRTYYELGRFFELLAKANLTALELLATTGENRIHCHPALEDLHVEDFLSKSCGQTFAGYARSQIRKAQGLNKKVHNPVAKELKTVLDFCYLLDKGRTVAAKQWLAEMQLDQSDLGLASINHAKDLYNVFLDGSQEWSRGIMRSTRANEVALSSIPKGAEQLAYLSFNQDAYSTYRRDYKAYWDWVDQRNDARYQGTLAHGGGYDAKNMMHTIRLLDMGIEILRDGELNVRRLDRDFLLSIKAGKYSLDEVLALAQSRLEQLEDLAKTSRLPEVTDAGLIEKKLVALREYFY